MKHIEYVPQGTCSQLISISGDNGRIQEVSFEGGCNGNLQGISCLVRGMTYQEVIDRLHGIRCGMKRTSCPVQLCMAIRQLMAEEADGQK